MSGPTGEMETQGTATAFKPWEPRTSPKPSEPPFSAVKVSADTVHAAELLTELAAGALPVAAAWKQVGDKRQRDYELLDAGAAADRSPNRHRPGATACLEVLFGRIAMSFGPSGCSQHFALAQVELHVRVHRGEYCGLKLIWNKDKYPILFSMGHLIFK